MEVRHRGESLATNMAQDQRQLEAVLGLSSLAFSLLCSGRWFSFDKYNLINRFGHSAKQPGIRLI